MINRKSGGTPMMWHLSKPEKLENALRDGAEKTSLQLSGEVGTICIGTVAADLRKRWKRLGIDDRGIVCNTRIVDGVHIPSYKIVELLILTAA